MPAVTTTTPSSITTTTGFVVNCSAGGASDYGQVSWAPTGHALLTPAGLSALASQCGSYHGALSGLTNAEQISIHGAAGSYAVKNADLAAQQAAIVAVLATTANVTGKAT